MASKKNFKKGSTTGSPTTAHAPASVVKRQPSVQQTVAPSPKPSVGWAAIAASKAPTPTVSLPVKPRAVSISPPAPAKKASSPPTGTSAMTATVKPVAPPAAAPSTRKSDAAVSRSKKSPSPTRDQPKQAATSKTKYRPPFQNIPPVNGFNRDEIREFLYQRMKSLEKSEQFKQTGSDWATKSRKHHHDKLDVVAIAFAKILKH